MALVTYNGTNYDDHLGSATITSTNVSVTTAGITSAGVTAPNLVNKITGCWIWVAALPSSGNLTVEIMESAVSKATATINNANVQLGANYVRFATPYTFATLTASAYTVRVKNTVANAGSLKISASGLWFAFTYDTARALGATDDVWVGGFNDAGMTAKTLTLSGTSNSWGSGVTGVTSNPTMGAALLIGSGGTVAFDTSASTTLTILGTTYITANGILDMRGSATKSRINTLVINSAALGDQGILIAAGTSGQVLSTGATYSIYSTYASGLGTAASPMITNIAWDADVGDEIVIGGGTDYSKNETKFIKTRNSSTSFVLCDTPGGAESALANTHTAGSHMCNLTRNVVIKPLDTAKGYYITNSGQAACDFSYTRFEYADSTSGKALNFTSNSTTTPGTSTFDGVVIYNSSPGNRYIMSVLQGATTTQTITGIVLYNTRGSNFSGQSGLYVPASNKVFNDCFFFNAPGGTTACAFMTLPINSVNIIFNNSHSYGANAGASSGGYAVGIYTGFAHTFNSCTFNATRSAANSPAIRLSSSNGITFNNCSFGNIATNTVDILTDTSTLNKAFFSACNFSSATLLSNYLNQLDTSLVSFQDMDGNTSKHRWYTNYGSWWSSGSGLTDTTVRTASSLALVSKPENATTGSSWIFKIPANPTSQVGIFGYMYRNATFSSGTLKIELFLPGTLITATPDASYTFPTTTGSWLPFNISAYYSGSVSRYAQVKITGVTATAGAYFFVDDLYDAGTGNKVAGLDLWDQGQPSPIMVSIDYSAIPAQVWGYSDSNTSANTMGKIQSDSKLTNVLVADSLS